MVSRGNVDVIAKKLDSASVSFVVLGHGAASPSIVVAVDGVSQVNETTSYLRHLWEETSFVLEKFQRLESCVHAEQEGLKNRRAPLDMSAMVYAAGLEPWDVTMSDLLNGRITLQDFRGIVFFQEFYERPDTFSLGVCNGCQLMALLALLKGMDGTTVDIWVAHGEGRVFFLSQNILDHAIESNLAPVRYCDDDDYVTEAYPFNPDGSPLRIAALCSPNGSNLALMPYPERSFLMWQFPWYPREWGLDPKGPSRWPRMPQNACEWCTEV
eukprot:Gb_17049 [translate_table: standard]